MEDGSAASVESILVQGGGLGFYQKRLFVCTCFLQALTVSALIYASHCRPDLSPTIPLTATNGVLAHQFKCGSRLEVGQNVLQMIKNSSLEIPVLNSTNGSETTSAEKLTVNNSFTLSPLTSTVDGVTNVVSAGTSHALLDTLTTSNVGTSTIPSNSATTFISGTSQEQEASRLSQHESSVESQTIVVEETSSSEALESVSSSFSDFSKQTTAYLSHTGYGLTSSGLAETRGYLPDGSQWESSPASPGKDKRDTQPSPEESTEKMEYVSSSERMMDTVSSTVDEATTSSHGPDDCVKGYNGEEDGAVPVYLTLSYLPAPEWLGDVNKEQLAQYNTYCQAVGAMVGAALGAMGADQAGRRKPLYLYFPLMLIAHCMSGFAVSWTMLAVFRFLVGAFAGACAVVSLVFPLEFIGTEWRDACMCSGIWVVGVVLISLELLVTRHWRYLAFISGGIGLPLIGTYYLVGSSVYFCLLAKVKVMTGNVYLDNSIPFVIDLPLGWSAVVVNRCLGRRWCLFLYAVASGLALLSVLVLHMTGNLSHMPSMITGMAVFGKIGVTASLSLVLVIAVEMYPTVVRCMGVSVGVIALTGGSLLSEAFVFLEAYHYTVPFVVFGSMMASVGFAGLLFPETLRRPLPNILPCRHRTIPLHEGVRLVTNPWDVL